MSIVKYVLSSFDEIRDHDNISSWLDKLYNVLKYLSLTDFDFVDYVKPKLIGYVSEYYTTNKKSTNILGKKSVVVWFKMKPC